MIGKFTLQNRSIVYLIVIHIVLGIVISVVPRVSFFWQLLVIGYGIIDIVRKRNLNDEAGLWSAYFAGMEVFLRMTEQSLFWELGKYIVILFLLLGLIFNKAKSKYTYIIYFLLLLPSILVGAYIDFSEARDMISFNLSGPLCLAVSATYFFKKKYTVIRLFSLFRMLVLPILAMVTYILVSSPDLSRINFGSGSNFTASGGYGPNQVSLILGIGIFLIIIFRFFGTSFSGFKWIDYFLVALVLFRALVTFSRGGVIGAALAIAVFFIVRILSDFKGKKVFNSLLILLVITAVGYFVWDYTNAVTKNALEFRYKGINPRTGEEKEYTTGRIYVIDRDISIFKDNLLLGVGPGKAKEYGSELGIQGVPAHTEWSRLLAEHGVFGVIALLILFITPLRHIVSLSKVTHPLLFALVVLALFSMFHAAMRLSIISYMYAWALIVPVGRKVH